MRKMKKERRRNHEKDYAVSDVVVPLRRL